MEGPTVGARRILGRNVRRADRNRVLHIGIVGDTMALELPVSGDLDGGPLLAVVEGRPGR